MFRPTITLFHQQCRERDNGKEDRVDRKSRAEIIGIHSFGLASHQEASKRFGWLAFLVVDKANQTPIPAPRDPPKW